MHLDHKLPWTTLASHFKLERLNKSHTPLRTDIFSLKKENEDVDLGHFKRKFIAAIREFSTTEQQKHTPIPDSEPPGDDLFSDDVLIFSEQLYKSIPSSEDPWRRNHLDKRHQSLQHWIDRASDDEGNATRYTSDDWDLADGFQALIIISAISPDPMISKEAMSAILRLAQHPRVPFRSLDSARRNNSYNLRYILTKALESYLLFNVVDKLQERGTKVKINELSCFDAWTYCGSLGDGYEVHNLPFRAFCEDCGVEFKAVWRSIPVATNKDDSHEMALDPLIHHREACQRHLRVCFAIMYKFHALRRCWYDDEDKADKWWEFELFHVFRRWGSRQSFPVM